MRSFAIRAAVACRLAAVGTALSLRMLGLGVRRKEGDCRQILKLMSVVMWRPAPGPARGPEAAP